MRPHPHIGLATVTFLWSGGMRHRDTLGSLQDILPGDVNWMTAGRGIAHSERTPPNLRDAGVPTGVLVAPVIPMITDMQLEQILEAAHDAGAQSAGYVLLRLPHELKEIWREWLRLHYPQRAEHVMSLVQQMRGGKDYDSAFGSRMRGQGPFADLVAMRFAKTRKRLGFEGMPPLRTDLFVAPRKPSPQGDLF